MDCLSQIYTIPFSAEWQSGHAADCKSVYAGSIPTSASNEANISSKTSFKVRYNLRKNSEKGSSKWWI